jgi:hypothetical protein
MQTMGKVYVVPKKDNIRGYETAKQVCFGAKKSKDAEKVNIHAKKVTFFYEKVDNIYLKHAEKFI